MPGHFLYKATLVLISLCLLAEARAQSASTETREAEWRSYKLPASEFARHFSPVKNVLLRVPAEWQQQGQELRFKGAATTELTVVVEEIPDGISIKSYTAALMTGLRNLPGGADSVSVRRTHMSGVEAREIMFELPDARGVLTRRVIWSAVDGPRALTLILNAPLSSINQTEPLFKAVVESVKIVSQGVGEEFEFLREAALKQSKPARIDEVLSLAELIHGFDPAERAKAVSKLASIFAASPDSAIDLVLDRRAMVRASAIEAIGRSGNKSLVRFLCGALSDPESFVADRAAIALARMPDGAQLLRDNYYNWDGGGIREVSRATAYLDEKTREQIAAELFIKVVPQKPAPKKIAPPPPPPRKPGRGAPPPRPVLEAVVIPFVGTEGLSVNKQLIAVSLLRNIPATNLKMPLDDIIAAGDDRVIAVALQVSLERGERLPVDSLFKLLSSSSEDVRRLAAMNLGQSASAADISRIESLAAKLTPEEKTATELAASVKKIRLVEQLNAATGSARRDLITTAAGDAQIADWVWGRYLRDEIEGPRPAPQQQPATDTPPARAMRVAPLGENLFPSKVSLYAALPDPGSALDKLGDSLAGIQMDSARGQANLVLLLSSFKEQIARFLGASPEHALIDYLGIKANSPFALATWRADGSPRAIASGERKAVTLAVRDRDRFERLLAAYQQHVGQFSNLPEYLSIGARFIGLAPALMPVAAASAIKDPPEARKDDKGLSYQVIAADHCGGYPVKVIEHRTINRQGLITTDMIYLAYVGEQAVLAPDWHSLRDALKRLASGGAAMGDNPDFKRAVAAGGEAIYMSDLGAVLSSITGSEPSSDTPAITESGALKISNAAWENDYRLTFKQSEWTRLLLPFKPGELTAPRRLLPSSTVAYFFLSLDLPGVWKDIRETLLDDKDIKAFASSFAVDFEKEVVTEIGPECGIAILALPDFGAQSANVPWVVFFRLRSEKLVEAFKNGKLFKPSEGAGQSAFVKIPSTSYVATIKNGFLVLSENESAFERLSFKENLASARDYERAARNSPGGLIAFGGYNLEAATAQLESMTTDPSAAQMITTMTSMARAFHSQTFYATASEGGADARLSVSLDREGRYSVAELSSFAKDFNLTYAFIQARGVPMGDQKRLEALKIKIRAKGSGAIDRIRQDVASKDQTAEKLSDAEMLLTVRPRRASLAQGAQLPISGPEFSAMLQPTREIRSDDKEVIAKAREIAGEDRDAWSVARKLSDWTYKNLKWKRIDDADAAQTLATREADCLEFSQLFIAMARALGLPARLVTGMAYDGTAFGGHAWVEVYAGEWIELDPTWGTEFVDATHIRGSSGDLISYAALNLVDVEVLEATRGVPDFQRDATSLAEMLCRELSGGETSALTAALDIAVVTDEIMGSGVWATLNDAERDRMSAAYQRAVVELSAGFKKQDLPGSQLRLLKVSQSGDRAEAIAMYKYIFEDLLVRFKFVRRGDAWTLIDVVQSDSDFRIVTEMMRPAAQAILARRNGKQPQPSYLSDFVRVLITMSEDAKAALEIAEESLKTDPKDRSLRFLKAMCLLQVEKQEEGLALLVELSEGEQPMSAALFRLASHYEGLDDEVKKATSLFERYTALVPDDPRGHESLAMLYESQDDARAESSYRAALNCDRLNPSRYVDLAEWLTGASRFADAVALIDEGAKGGAPADEIFASWMSRLIYSDEEDAAERLARARPDRMETSADANLYLAYSRMRADRMREALPLLKKSSQLDPKSAAPHTAMAEAYLSLGQYKAALASSDAAIRIDNEDSEAHYHRGCALARLRRAAEAMASLRRAVELDEDLLDHIEEEAHLKSLARLPEFRKLVKGEAKEKDK